MSVFYAMLSCHFCFYRFTLHVHGLISIRFTFRWLTGVCSWIDDAALTLMCVRVEMFRRSRFSIRPNVGVAGRTAATPQEAPPVNQEASETPRDVGDSNTSVTENQSVVTPSEKPTVQG